jgi:hypothetical protein
MVIVHLMIVRRGRVIICKDLPPNAGSRGLEQPELKARKRETPIAAQSL